MALKHSLVSLSENLYKSAIKDVEKIKDDENQMEIDNKVGVYNKRLLKVLDICRNMLGFLIVVPEDPDNDHLHLYTTFAEIIQKLKRDEQPVLLAYIRLYSEMLKYLAC